MKGKRGNTPTYIKVTEVKNDTLALEVEAFGRVTSTRNVNLAAEVSGRLMEGKVPLKTGQHFAKGELLFGIHDAEQRLALQARKSQFLNLMASILPDLKVDFPDNFNAWEEFFKQLEVDRSLPALPQTKSINEKTFLASRNLLSEYYGIQGDEERLRKYRVSAPFNGIYTDVTAEVGAVVNAGTQVARIIAYDALEVKVPVSVSEIGLLKKGASVNLHNEEGSKSWQGEVLRIGRNVNENTQSVDVFVKVNSADHDPLYEGMYVKALIHCGELPQVYEVSRKAIFDENKVYVVHDSIMKVKSLKVEKLNELTVIASGLENNELLVIQPTLSAKENAKVIPIKE